MSRPARPEIAWRDLVALSRFETLRELALPLPWLVLAIVFAFRQHTVLAIVCTFVLFMTGLRVTHGAFHRSLGLSARGDDAVMFVLSALLGGSMHAIEHTHLAHHRDPLGRDDVEGHIAHRSFLHALISSPLYPWQIHAASLRRGDARTRRWVRRELIVAFALIAAVWSIELLAPLRTITFALMFANASAAMVGIWAVHHGCEHEGFIARTSRWPWLDRLAAHMFLHLEHHLYPAVPTCHLPMLVKRFDAARNSPVRLVHPPLATIRIARINISSPLSGALQ
jgi:fatty acid desaturase